MLPSVLNLAAAGGMDLAYASDLVTDAMASLNLEASKANVDEFGNKLAKAASKANANVSQLGEAILTVGGTAANLKGGTTELTTALGLLANVGIKGAEGGTHLRNIILSLQSPTKDAREVMEQLGLESTTLKQHASAGRHSHRSEHGYVRHGAGRQGQHHQRAVQQDRPRSVNGLLAAQGEQWESLAQQIDAAGEAAGDSGAMARWQRHSWITCRAPSPSCRAPGGPAAGYLRLSGAQPERGSQVGLRMLLYLTKALSEGGPEAMLQAAGQIISDLAASVTAQLPGWYLRYRDHRSACRGYRSSYTAAALVRR